MNIVIDLDELTAEEFEELEDFLGGSTIPYDRVKTDSDPDDD